MINSKIRTQQNIYAIYLRINIYKYVFENIVIFAVYIYVRQQHAQWSKQNKKRAYYQNVKNEI